MTSIEEALAWIADRRRESARKAPKEEATAGDIWYASPRDTPVLAHYKAPGQRARYQLLSPALEEVAQRNVEGTAWVKIKFNSDPIGRPTGFSPRPGIVVGRKHQRGHTVMVPGYTDPEPPGVLAGMPTLQLEVSYPSGLEYSGGYYLFWMPWGMSSVPGRDLLDRFGHLRNCSSPSEADCPSAARRRMAELIGGETPTWGPKDKDGIDMLRRSARYRRGEVVLVRMVLTSKPVPCVVVSDDLLNGSNHHRLVVLQTTEHKDGDDRKPHFVPIEVPGYGLRSVVVVAVRALTNVMSSVSRPVSRTMLPVSQVEAWRILTDRLKECYE